VKTTADRNGLAVSRRSEDPRAHLRLAAIFLFVVYCLVLLLGASSLSAQDKETGVTLGNYFMQQSMDIGGRFAHNAGNSAVYNTFVHLDSGLRLYDYTMSMRSLNHSGWLFDNLSITGFGYGGDPNDVTRIRATKNKWYNFDMTWRRDKNFWDYSLLANPLNPTISTPALIVQNSPHRMETVRRMQDYRMILFPQSRFRVRLGYSRNVYEGPSFSTDHQGTDTIVLQTMSNTVNNYQVGLDFKFLTRTSFSYDQFINVTKGDTGYRDINFGNFILGNPGQTPVDLGIVFNTAASSPCAVPIAAGPPTVPPTANPNCNAFLSYNRTARPRLVLPVEQFSLQSNYFRRLQITGRASYSSGTNNIYGMNEVFTGAVSRSAVVGMNNGGPANSQRTAFAVDFDATLSINDENRILESFRFSNTRLPGFWNFSLVNSFPQGPLSPGNLPSMLMPVGTYSAAQCPNPITLVFATTCPQHTTSSGADFSTGLYSYYLAQDAKYNTIQFEHDFSKWAGVRGGFRYAHRNIADSRFSFINSEIFFPAPTAALAFRGDCAKVAGVAPAGCTVDANGVVTYTGPNKVASTNSELESDLINEFTVVMGVWARPTSRLRMNFDAEFFVADNSFTRISPRDFKHYKGRIIYEPRPWLNLSLSANWYDGGNNTFQINNLQFNHSIGFDVAIEPHHRFGMDFGYDFNDIFSTISVCYYFSGAPIPPGTSPCPLSAGGTPLQSTSVYTSLTHFAYFDVRVMPIKRVTMLIGSSINSVSGNALVLTPTAPAGPLDYNCLRPYASLGVDLAKNLSLKAKWSYYDYHEKALPNPIASHSFRSNLVDAILHYEF
jgi:hypothetical protein